MKELKTVCDELIKFFNIDDIGYLGDKLKEIILSDNRDDIYDRYIELVEDMDIDWIQKIFQYYKSNRSDFKQDYTPKSLAKCLAKMVYWEGAKTAYDACSGSGSLVIELHKLDNKIEFVCEEFDDNVIPYLLFNLSIRNISAVVIQGDIVKQERYNFYKLTPGNKYSKIEIIDGYDIGNFDIITSNPPFNLEKFRNSRNFNFGIEVKNSSNSYFLLHCMELLSDEGRMGIILPTGYVTSQKKDDLAVREYIVEQGLMEAVVSCPGNFFESTPVNTSIIFINKDKIDNRFVLIDNTSKNCTEWIREQRGQFGGAAHTSRVYKKKFNVFSDDNIEKILKTIIERVKEDDYSVVMTYTGFNENFSYSPGQYFPVKIQYVNITQEQYDNMIASFFKGFDEFCDGIVKAKEEFEKVL